MLQITGNYRLLHLLGQGASAQVYLGEHSYLQTYAAIKLLRTKSKLSAAEKREFMREAQLLAKLHHPHIVRVLDFAFTDEDIPFLVMEYAAHGSLRQRHPRGTRLRLSAVSAYLEQLVEPLTYIHRIGVTHGDIKPENMLLDAHNQLLLGDFGIATLALQTMQFVGGTPAYMAPEQIQRRPCAASDQYGLATVIYEWLSGQTPFQGKTPEEIMDLQVYAAAPPLRQLVPHIPAEVEEVVMRGLAKDPAQRFSSIEAFADAFEQALPDSMTTPRIPVVDLKGAVVVSTAGSQSSVSAVLETLPAEFPDPLSMTNSGLSLLNPIYASLVVRETPLPATRQTGPEPAYGRQGETFYTLDLEAGFVRALAWSPDGQTLAAGTDYQEVFTWDALTRENRRSHHLHENQVRALAWSPVGRTLASACADQCIQLWEPDKPGAQPLLTYRGHMGDFTLGLACAVAWSPSSLLLASAGTDRTAQVWRANDGELICTCRGHLNDINALCWSPEGTQLATASDDGTVRLWNAWSGQEIANFRHHRGPVYALAWSPDGETLASAGEGNAVYIWNARDRVQTHYQLYQGHIGPVRALAWSPDGSLLASGSCDTTVQIWKPDTRERQYTYSEHKSPVLALAWSPGGSYLASSGDDSTVHVWRAM
jgi:serine/threonine protein kinase